MSDVSTIPTPLPPEYRPPTFGQRIIALLAWIIILGVSGLIFYSQGRDHSQPPGRAGAASPATSPAVSAARQGNGGFPPSTEMELTARYAVGTQTTLHNSGVPISSETSAKLVASVEDAARSPLDQLRAVGVVGELSGAGAALDRLDQVEKELGSRELRLDAQTLRAIYTRGPRTLDGAQRDRLVRDHGWFGSLALSFGAGTADPVRQAAVGAARQTFWVLLLAILTMFLVLAVGLVFCIVAIVFAVSGRLRSAYVPPTRYTGPFLEAFAVYLAGFLLLSLAIHWLTSKPSLLMSAIVLPLFAPLPILWPRLRGVGWNELRAAIGWRRGRGVLREIGAGLIGYLAGIPIIAVGVVICIGLHYLTRINATHPIVNELAGSGAHLLVIYFLACVVAPVFEETMFRGMLYHHLRRRWGWVMAALPVAVLFAAIHPQGWTAMPVLGAIALVLATLREWRGSLIASMTAHALNNFLAITMIVLALR